MKHIFVLAMDDLQRKELETVRNAENYEFHNVLDIPTLVEAEEIEFDRLLEQSRSEIKDAGVSVDAIIAHWDFPSSVLAPILGKEFGVPAPSLESVLKCEHKYWSRLEQAKAVPDVVPKFCNFDPFAEDPRAEIDLEFPFWVKPVKSFSSQLGFLIKSEADFDHAIEKTREGIGRIGSAFDEALAHIELPEELRNAGGMTCLAEEIIDGTQIAPEGSVRRGKIDINGVIDVNKDETGTKIDRFEYPSSASEELQQKVIDTSEKIIKHIGFDNGCFNVEFMWDEKKQQLWLIEINTRISQSHSEMFILVDGMSNHATAIEVALGEETRLPKGEGPYNVAAKFTIMHPDDGIVERTPSDKELEELEQMFPGMHLKLDVKPGMRLSEKVNQDAYQYVLGEVYLGADSQEELLKRYDECLDVLQVEIRPVG
ncbi:ATP-grasp domain-containing protein [Marinobacter salicampi]|uniref:ATP-grasp domain-containing protein n=1 Tax=Marinobacter salicampi TaxID=435907 RepID=UPI0014075D56|nr:ATP-grasp domain-containing protein [Marinobacter salicampi]